MRERAIVSILVWFTLLGVNIGFFLLPTVVATYILVGDSLFSFGSLARQRFLGLGDKAENLAMGWARARGMLRCSRVLGRQGWGAALVFPVLAGVGCPTLFLCKGVEADVEVVLSGLLGAPSIL